MAGASAEEFVLLLLLSMLGGVVFSSIMNTRNR
jgi:hypothetical protein